MLQFKSIIGHTAKTIITCVYLYRILYWTDWNPSSPGIYRSSVVNPAREALVSADIYWPNALAIDFTGNCYN